MKKVSNLTVVSQKGVYIGIPSSDDSANRLENWKYDAKTTSWSNELGFEKFFSNSNNFAPFQGSTQRKVDSVYVWPAHSGARQSFLYETNGQLFELNGSTETVTLLLSNRNIPTDTGFLQQYSPYGRYLVISNGLDSPIKYRASRGGSDRIFDLGWRNIPGTPTVRTVGQPDGQPRTFIDAASNVINGQIWKASDAFFRGVTGTAVGDKSLYAYRVSFVNEAGSESPLSNPSNEISFTAVSITRGSTTGVPRTGFILNIPIGPAGTIARRIYRTKNDGSIYFFNAQVSENTSSTYSDFLEDVQLGSEAPTTSESISMPSPSCRFTAAFKDCLFIDGGQMDPQRLWYSQPRQPDTYRADNYFDLGTVTGGDITGLMPYYNSLLVFREAAIDLIRGDSLNGFTLTPFIQGVGTRSPNCILPIPNIGISFMSNDGIYLIAGGLDGGSDLKLRKISIGLEEFFDRACIDMFPKAVAAYSSREREAHYYFAIDGSTFNNKGIVFHVDNKTFSERTGFPVQCITTDHDGNFIAGYDLHNTYSGVSPSNPPADTPAKGGLFVLSGRRQAGYVFSGSGLTIKENKPLNSTFRSAWMDMGDLTLKKQVKYVYLSILSRGDTEIQMEAYKDREWANGVTAGTMKQQRPDHPDQPVYDNDLYRWDKVDWQDKLLTRIRFDVANMSCMEFAFEFSTNDACEFIGFQVEYTVDGTKVIGGKK